MIDIAVIGTAAALGLSGFIKKYLNLINRHFKHQVEGIWVITCLKWRWAWMYIFSDINETIIPIHRLEIKFVATDKGWKMLDDELKWRFMNQVSGND